MNTYLAIITTILVLTQIIRVAQNAINLSQRDQFERQNNKILELYRSMEFHIRNIDDKLEDNE